MIAEISRRRALLYLQHLAEAKSSKAAVEEAVNGLAWAHMTTGVQMHQLLEQF